MSRILAYQQQKQKFYRSRVNTHKVYVATTEEAGKVRPLGTLEPNGKLTINPALKAILEENGRWKDFNETPSSVDT